KGVPSRGSAAPAQRSMTASPSIKTEKRAACSSSPSGPSVKLAAKASFTAAKRSGQTPWISGSSVIDQAARVSISLVLFQVRVGAFAGLEGGLGSLAFSLLGGLFGGLFGVGALALLTFET